MKYNISTRHAKGIQKIKTLMLFEFGLSDRNREICDITFDTIIYLQNLGW